MIPRIYRAVRSENDKTLMPRVKGTWSQDNHIWISGISPGGGELVIPTAFWDKFPNAVSAFNLLKGLVIGERDPFPQYFGTGYYAQSDSPMGELAIPTWQNPKEPERIPHKIPQNRFYENAMWSLTVLRKWCTVKQRCEIGKRLGL